MGDLSDAVSSLDQVTLLDYLENDPRATFIFNIKRHSSEPTSGLDINYTNKAFQQAAIASGDRGPQLSTASLTYTTDAETAAFVQWAQIASADASYRYQGYEWTVVSISCEWRVVSGLSSHSTASTDCSVPCQPGDSGNRVSHASHSTTESQSADTMLGVQVFDFLTSPLHKTSDFYHAMRDFDWTSSVLGPISSWSLPLLQNIPYLLVNPGPCSIFWGSERTLVYNEEYAGVIQDLHPAAMGASAKAVFATIWSPFEASIKEVESTKRAVTQKGASIKLNRSDFVEEVWFDYIFMPLFNHRGEVCGIFNQAFEVTKELVTHAQMNCLITLGNETASKSTLNEFWPAVFDALQHFSTEVPFIAVYSLGDEILMPLASTDECNSVAHESEDWRLQGSVGYPENHPAILKELDLTKGQGLAPALKLASSGEGPVTIDKSQTILQDEIFTGCTDSGVGSDFTKLVVCPITLSSEKIIGYLALGINPLRPYDSEYIRFVQLLVRQMEDTVRSIISTQKERLHLEKTVLAAETQKIWLSGQLELQIREARQSDLRFYNFAEQAPVGVYILGTEGEIKYCNDAWYKLVGIPFGYKGAVPWRIHVHPDDRQSVDDEWIRLTQGKSQSNFEWRAIRAPKSENDPGETVYLRSSCFPELAEDGSMISVTGILMDVSIHKAHEAAVADKLSDALEAKRAQENFMDMVSHEMRNPLNAMLQCAEEASESLALHEAAKDVIDAIETIQYCGRHQKQIIDDVLTISKLDADLLTLSPGETVPVNIVNQVVKIFASDIRAGQLEVALNVSGDSRVPCVMDFGRVLQILINLVGNAIKFMKDRPTRQLTLSVDTSKERPESEQMKYYPSGRERKVLRSPTSISGSASPDWGKGDPVYISFSVTDTGPGLAPEEAETLFTRFKQASPRTHAQYGGSGLGLFISRELAELHGGEIGLQSGHQQGSTFAFYVKGGTSVRKPSASAIPGQHPTSLTVNEDVKPRIQTTVAPSEINILIVEDNLVNQKVLKRQLDKLGYQTMTANHGQEAIDIVQRSHWWHETPQDHPLNISVVLCDLEMPVMDGMTCARYIRQWQDSGNITGHIPMVAVTGNARAEQVNAAKIAGFDDVVCKPYSVPDLAPLIHRLTRP